METVGLCPTCGCEIEDGDVYERSWIVQPSKHRRRAECPDCGEDTSVPRLLEPADRAPVRDRLVDRVAELEDRVEEIEDLDGADRDADRDDRDDRLDEDVDADQDDGQDDRDDRLDEDVGADQDDGQDDRDDRLDEDVGADQDDGLADSRPDAGEGGEVVEGGAD